MTSSRKSTLRSFSQLSTSSLPGPTTETKNSIVNPHLDVNLANRRVPGPSSASGSTTPRSPSALPPRIVEPSDSSAYPRRRVSLSVNSSPIGPGGAQAFLASPHVYSQPHSLSYPHGRHPLRRRARTMSFPIRTSQYPPAPTPLARVRRVTMVLLVLLTLFLVGTVVVLSSISYWLAIPAWAPLTEDEVAWTPADAIAPLKYSPPGTAIPKRMLPLNEDEERDEREELAQEFLETSTGYEDEDWLEQQWDVDGRGSGAYWMVKDWDGHVHDTHDWERLYNVTARPGERMPRLIHQTWKDDHLPVQWRKAWKECREGMADYEYMLWTDDVSRDFIKTHYPSHLHMYDSYKYPIQRADSIRYFVLHHFGGIYMDLDIGCRRRLDSLLQGDWDTVLPITKPVGVSNDLILSSKGSPFMDDTIHALPAWNHEWVSNYPTVMFSTGPMFLSAQFAVHASAHPVNKDHPRSEVRILPKFLYGKNIAGELVPQSFFSHFYGSSWHEDDAGFIAFLGQEGRYLMWIGGVVVFLGVARLFYVKLLARSLPQYQLVSVLPTSSASSPTRDADENSSSLEAINSQHLPHDIASALKRAGNLILAAPATLLSGDRRNGRRRTGLLYFVPALFQPGPVTPRRGRTSSEAFQLPVRRSKREKEKPETLLPPKYTRAVSDTRIHLLHDEPESMDEMDASSRSGRFSDIGGFRDEKKYDFNRDIESGSSSATEEGEGGEASETSRGSWSEWQRR